MAPFWKGFLKLCTENGLIRTLMSRPADRHEWIRPYKVLNFIRGAMGTWQAAGHFLKFCTWLWDNVGRVCDRKGNQPAKIGLYRSKQYLEGFVEGLSDQIFSFASLLPPANPSKTFNCDGIIAIWIRLNDLTTPAAVSLLVRLWDYCSRRENALWRQCKIPFCLRWQLSR